MNLAISGDEYSKSLAPIELWEWIHRSKGEEEACEHHSQLFPLNVEEALDPSGQISHPQANPVMYEFHPILQIITIDIN